MGTFTHPLTLRSPSGDRTETVEAWVDTGSNPSAGLRTGFSRVPAGVLQRLGVQPDRERGFVLADGSRVRREMAELKVELNGEQVTTLVVFAPEGTQPLIGAVTLESFSLTADVTNKCLVPAESLALGVTLAGWRTGWEAQRC
ncbi:MAG: hypothetical protein HYY02_02280 [Chloroflexi bacterium]|nr:hypothetical protein [Chloroflexota bacterium]